MEDIQFDLIAREIVISGSGDNSDFELTQNPSVQNGGNMMYSRAANIYLPIFGIGVEDFMNSNLTTGAKILARWQQQVQADGGKGSYTSTPVDARNFDFNLYTDYL